MTHRSSPLARRTGYALPMTLMAIAGLLLLCVGLLIYLQLERKTARSYSDVTRAQLACESGLSDAINTLSHSAVLPGSLVFRLDSTSSGSSSSPPFFTFAASYGPSMDNPKASSWRIRPLFSGLKEFDGGATTPNADKARSLLNGLALENLYSTTAPDASNPQAAWVNLSSGSDPNQSRYAWWIEDLSGRIDGSQAGASPRDQGLSTKELGLFTVFQPTQQKDGAGPEDAIIAARGQILSPASTRLILPSSQTQLLEPYVAYNLPPLKYDDRVVPFGFGYADAGKKTMDLTQAVSKRDVTGIANMIERNLPQFSLRKGSCSADYLKTLAASIVDYADGDSDATVGANYRGVDSYPFVNELFDRYAWIGTGNGAVTIRVSTYVELWNMTQKTISGAIEFENVNRHMIRIPPVGSQTFSPVTFPAQNVTVPANGFLVLALGVKDYSFPTGIFPPTSLDFPSETYTSSFRLKWNGVLVDTAPGGLTRTTGTLAAGESKAKWKGNSSPALDTSIAQYGDPRATFYIQARVFPNNYDANSNWGGRAVKFGISTSTTYREVKLQEWPDRGLNSAAGTCSNSDSVLPTQVIPPANEPKKAPAYIANTDYQSVGELGHIFDPSQWANVFNPSSAPSNAGGGGYTLAIGRPEFGRFDVEGQRAAQLTDLFSLNTAASASPTRRINLNTAPREVLRALAAGQPLKNDPGQTEKQVTDAFYPANSAQAADRFADAVIATRNRYPLRGLSDFARIRLNPDQSPNYAAPDNESNLYFGVVNQYQKAPKPDLTWDDAGREELFTRLCNLVDFGSRVFRVVVAGQSLQKSNSKLYVKARSVTEYWIALEPQRDASGAINPTKPPTITKIYETSYDPAATPRVVTP